MEKILLLLPGGEPEAVCDMARQAAQNACYPNRLRAAAALDAPATAAIPLEAGEKGKLFSLWQGEEYVLSVPEGTMFEHHWDLALVSALLRLKNDKALLTGYLPRPEDPYGPMPVAAKGFDEEGSLTFHPGTPMCHCLTAQPCAFIHPAFVFAPAAFFKEVTEEPLFLTAFVKEWEPFTLPVAALRHPAMPPVAAFEVKAFPAWQEGDPMDSFEEEYGLDLMARRLSAAARLGLYTPHLQYEMKPSPLVVVREALRQAAIRRKQPSPLWVTAYREMACPVKHLGGEYESWFANLARLKEMPLMLYARGDAARRARRRFSNIYELHQRYGLPLDRVWEPADDLWQFKAGKVFLLARTLNSQPHHSHYGWIDFGYQRWPMYARTAFDWRPLCDDVIHLARVAGMLDLSAVMIPRELVRFVGDEMLHEVTEALKAGRRPSEAEMWEAIIERNPREFMIHEFDSPRSLLSLCHL